MADKPHSSAPDSQSQSQPPATADSGVEREETGEPQYGLPNVRDPKTGELQAVDHEYEWREQTVRIKLVPPTMTQLDQYENLGAEVAPSKMREIVGRHVEKPPVAEYDSLSMGEALCYMEGIFDYCNEDDSDLVEAAREALEEREAEQQGN